MKIFLDDQHAGVRKGMIPEGFIGVANFDEFKQKIDEAIENGEVVEAISFDNDLGEGELEGWEIARWLSNTHPELFATSPDLRIHSANPEGRKTLEHHLTFGQEHFLELIEAKSLPDPWAEIDTDKR